MKTKNVILGLCALVFAVGSAFASLSLVTRYIRVDTRASQGIGCTDHTMVCIPKLLTTDCTNSGSFSCIATISSTALPSGTTTPIRNASCIILQNTTASPLVTWSDNCITKVYSNP